MNMVIEQRREQVVGHTDRVQVAIEVQVDVFHGNHLRITAAGGTALHAKHRAQRRLSQTNRDVLTDVLERVTQTHRRRGFAFTRRGRADRRHQNHARVVAQRLLKQPVQIDLAFSAAIGLQRLIGNVECLGNFGDGLGGRGLGDFDIRCHGCCSGD